MAYIGAGVQRFNTADNLTVSGTSELKNNVTVTGDVTASGTVLPTGDTAAGDAAALGFTSTEGLILTGQGSTSDITVKNDADATVFTVPTGTDDILFPDDAKILMGAGSDLQIHHSGTNSLINDVGPGNLELRTNGTDIRLVGNGGSDFMVQAISNGAVNLFHDNSQKLATTSTGCAITGGLTTTDSVGIGTSSIDAKLHIEVSSGDANLKLEDGSATNMIIDQNSIAGSDVIRFKSGSSGSERARIDSSGNVLVGTTNANPAENNVAGIGFLAGNSISVTDDGGAPIQLNRKTSDGSIAVFRKDGATVGVIGTTSSELTVGTAETGLRFNSPFARIIPHNTTSDSSTDDVLDIGASGNRFDDIFATNGTIQTSDQNEKQDIATLTSAEITAAKAISKLFKTFKWKSKVAAKGDAARTHTGLIAQEVQAAMTDAGLNASKYAFWCSDTWWEHSVDVAAVEAVDEVRDEDGNVTTEAVEAKDAYTRIDTYQTADAAPEGAIERTRLGVRYPELLAFIGAATEQRLADIETRLTALENA